MLRYIYVIVGCIDAIIFYLIVMKKYSGNPGKYSEEDCYKLAQSIVLLIKRRGRIDTLVFGTENLPPEGGYIMYANHQGKYDALSVIAAHAKPCTVVIAMKQSKALVTNQFVDLIKAKRLDIGNLRQQVAIMRSVADEVGMGRRYLVFPEGGYQDNRNRLQKFRNGSFKCAEKAKCPIVPVALYDSYKPFSINSLSRVETQLHFLEAIPYKEYQGMKTVAIKNMVVQRIEECIWQIEQEKQRTNYSSDRYTEEEKV